MRCWRQRLFLASCVVGITTGNMSFALIAPFFPLEAPRLGLSQPQIATIFAGARSAAPRRAFARAVRWTALMAAVLTRRHQSSERNTEREIPREKFGEKNSGREIPGEKFRERHSERDIPREKFRERNSEREIPREKFRERNSEREIRREKFRERNSERE
eukprot:SAG31_NODE_5016_length_2799_cov_58.320000_1_plen_159_part_10